MKWSDLSMPWRAVFSEAWAAYASDRVPIGAVVVSPEGEILSRGRNRIGERGPIPGQITGGPLAHAEINALLQLGYEQVDPHICTLYSLIEPCPLCMGAIYMSGVRRFTYACRDPYAGSANILGTTPYLARKAVRPGRMGDAVMEGIAAGLHTEFVLRNYLNPPVDFMDVWRATLPQGVGFGETLFASGAFFRLVKEFPAGSPEGAYQRLSQEWERYLRGS